MFQDDQPQWIRDLYRDIYPQAPIYPAGPRTNPATRVSGWRGSGPMSRQDLNPRTATFENQIANMMNLPTNMNTPTGGLAPPNNNITTGTINPWEAGTTVNPSTPPIVTPPISSGQASDDATALLNRFSGVPGIGGNVRRFLQSNEYRRFRGLPNATVAPFGSTGPRRTPRHDLNPPSPLHPSSILDDILRYLRGEQDQSQQTFGSVPIP